MMCATLTYVFASPRALGDVDHSFEVAVPVYSEDCFADTEEVIFGLLRTTAGIHSNVETKPKEQRRR